MKNKYFAFQLIMATLILFLTSCEKTPEGTDGELFNFAKKTEGFTWYKNTSELLDKSALSGHAEDYLRTRYNSIAANHLDENYKVADSAVFAEGSVIVKELYETKSKLSLYAVMYKKPLNIDADNDGWVWGYIYENGKVKEPASNKGAGCRTCHAQPGNIDFTLMNKSFE